MVASQTIWWSAGAHDGERRSQEYMERPYFTSLDGVRALSVLAVLWHHSVVAMPSLPFTGRGFLGVDMFFVLSGFLITTILLREQDATGGMSLRIFYARRALRIFPLYYAIVMGCLALGLVSAGSQLDAIADSAPSLLLYMTNWFPTISLLAVSWSLATEEQFYLVWPAVMKYGARVALVGLALFAVANQAVNFGLIFSDHRDELEILQVTFTPIVGGVVLAYLLHHRFVPLWNVLGSRAAAPTAAVAVGVLVALPSADPSLVGLHRLSIHVGMTLLLASLVVREDHLLAGILRMEWLVRIGVVSYGMYLLHMFVRHVIVETLIVLDVALPPVAFFVALGLFTYLAAEVTFRWFEAPLLALKPRAAGRPAPVPVPVPVDPRIGR